MMTTVMRLAICTLFAAAAFGAGEKPQPRVVTPGNGTLPPSDAIVLFDGKNVDGWTGPNGQPPKCRAIGGELVCRTGDGDLTSREKFLDAQIHIEFQIPYMPNQKGQMRGNSGVFLQNCYEMQILDSYQNPTYIDGMLGALYSFSPPMVNASRRPMEWQSYDVVFRAPRCSSPGTLSKPGRVTAFLNGVLVVDGAEIAKLGPGCQGAGICEPGALRLQDHSGFKDAPDTTMKFRNIWVRRLE